MKYNFPTFAKFFFSLFLCIFFIKANAATVYVNHLATGLNNGSSWANAYTDFQVGLMAASEGDEVWVAAGTYKPNFSPPGFPLTILWAKMFFLDKNLKIYGGFTGNETHISQRDISNNPTILDGDRLNDDMHYVNYWGNHTIINNSDNSLHVFIVANQDTSSVIDGLTIQGGNANSNTSSWYTSDSYGGIDFERKEGGGLYLLGSSTHIENCTFKDNAAEYNGSGLHTKGSGINNLVKNCTFSKNVGTALFSGYHLSTLSVINCLFEENTISIDNFSTCLVKNSHFNNNNGTSINNSSAYKLTLLDNLFTNNTSTYNGVIHNSSDSTLHITRCEFYDNISKNGAVLSNNETAILTNCILKNNTSTERGGAIYNTSASTSLYNCLLQNNKSAEGGSVFNHYYSNINFYNCVIYGDSATEKGDVFYNREFSSIRVYNSIIWDSLGVENFDSNAISYFHNSIIAGSGGSNNWSFSGMDMGGNLDVNPLFENPHIGDFNLQIGSPAINAGDDKYAHDSLDFIGNSRVQLSNIDLGLIEMPSSCLQSVVVQKQNVDCHGGNTGTVQLNIISNNALTYNWSNGMTTKDISLLSAGNYICTITDAVSQCSDTLFIKINESEPIQVQKIIIPESTTGIPSEVRLNVNGGQAPYSYQWSGGNTFAAEVLYSASSGSYTVTITDAKGCTTIDTSFIPYGNYTNVNRFYVNKNATGQNTGTSWTDAFSQFATAVRVAQDGDEIWVAQGTYVPRRETQNYGIQRSTFFISNNVKIYGGFDGTETQLSQRDVINNETILSGDLDQNDINTEENIAILLANKAENSLHVVTVNGVDSTTLLDGFTITNGHAYNFGGWSGVIENDEGGGIFCYNDSARFNNLKITENLATWGGGVVNKNSSSRFTNCIFTKNLADLLGGGIYNYSNSNVTIDNCIFTENKTTFITSTSNYGGPAISVTNSVSTINNTLIEDNFSPVNYNDYGAITFRNSDFLVENCTIKNNTSAKGGAIHCTSNSSGTIANSVISGNTSRKGGAFFIDASHPKIINCLISNNEGIEEGGAGYHESNAHPKYINCTLVNNRAGFAYVFRNSWAGQYMYNSIVWTDNPPYNSAPMHADYLYTPRLFNSLIADTNGGGYSYSYGSDSGGNIFSNPIFLDTIDYKLSINSPGVNAGDNTRNPYTIDLNGLPRIEQNTIDMGAYELKPRTLHFVNQANTTGSNNGDSWANAYVDLQNAFDISSNGDTIWVAQGNYIPSSTHHSTQTPVARDINFHLDKGVRIYGGFLGIETDLIQRDYINNPTIISGDINNDDILTSNNTIINNDENAFHTFIIAGATSPVHIDGFSIIGGNADSSGSILQNQVVINRNTGGGLSIYSSDVTIENCIFEQNSSTGEAGGLYLASLNANLNNLTFNNNFSRKGGALYSRITTINMNNTDFLENHSNNSGGAIYSLSSDITYNNGLFSKNKSTTNGGSIYTISSTIKLTDLAFDENAANSGAGMYISSNTSAILNDVSFDKNIASNDGGAIHSSNSIITSDNLLFNENTANQGGAIYTTSSSSVTFNDVSFDKNIANSNGGAIYNLNSTLIADTSVLNENRAIDGGAIYLASNSSITLDHISFDQNIASNNGGAIYNNTSSIIINKSEFINNQANNDGGAIYSFSGNNTTVINTYLNDNTADDKGGVIYNSGGIYSLINCLVLNNSASTGGVFANISSGSGTSINSTFSTNSASEGSTIFSEINTNLDLKNSIFWENGNNSFKLDDPNAVNVYNSLIEGSGGSSSWNNTFGIDNGNNLGVDPLFVNITTGDYKLKAGSLALNAGDNTFNNTTHDIENNNRIIDGTIDMGVFEGTIHVSTFNILSSKQPRIYPSPAQSFLNLELNESSIVNLHSSDGKLYWSNIFEKGTHQMAIGNLPAGVYFLSFNGQFKAIPFIKN